MVSLMQLLAIRVGRQTTHFHKTTFLRVYRHIMWQRIYGKIYTHDGLGRNNQRIRTPE